MRNLKLFFLSSDRHNFVFVFLPQVLASDINIPAGRMEKGAKVGHCRASTSRGCTGVTVTTAIKTGLWLKSTHRALQRLTRCNRADRISLFKVISLFHPFFFPSPLRRRCSRLLRNTTHWSGRDTKQQIDKECLAEKEAANCNLTGQFSKVNLC